MRSTCVLLTWAIISAVITQNRRLLPRSSGHVAHGVFGLPIADEAPLQIPFSAPLPSRHPGAEAWLNSSYGRYRLRLASGDEDRVAVCRLRFKVFNIELGEGLAASYTTGLDEDPFDFICDHLIVEDASTGRVVGTYRMQSGSTASAHLGYYSAQEFDFFPYESIRGQVLEVGRASIDRDHRSSDVLTLLWRGIAQYARVFGLRYLVGCSSINSQDPRIGWDAFTQLEGFLAPADMLTVPTPRYTLPPGLPSASGEPEAPARVPRLLKTYLGVGARICGPPAWDRAFGTIDFLTLLDLERITRAARNRFVLSR